MLLIAITPRLKDTLRTKLRSSGGWLSVEDETKRQRAAHDAIDAALDRAREELAGATKQLTALGGDAMMQQYQDFAKKFEAAIAEESAGPMKRLGLKENARRHHALLGETQAQCCRCQETVNRTAQKHRDEIAELQAQQGVTEKIVVGMEVAKAREEIHKEMEDIFVEMETAAREKIGFLHGTIKRQAAHLARCEKQLAFGES